MGNGSIICIECGKEQDHWEKNCIYCGHPLYYDDEGYAQVLEFKRNMEMAEQRTQINEEIQYHKKDKEPMFTDEQILVTGLYPKNSFFKGLLISRILGKK